MGISRDSGTLPFAAFVNVYDGKAARKFLSAIEGAHANIGFDRGKVDVPVNSWSLRCQDATIDDIIFAHVFMKDGMTVRYTGLDVEGTENVLCADNKDHLQKFLQDQGIRTTISANEKVVQEI